MGASALGPDIVCVVKIIDLVTTIKEARECVGEDQEQTNTTLRISKRARKRANFDEFMYYDD